MDYKDTAKSHWPWECPSLICAVILILMLPFTTSEIVKVLELPDVFALVNTSVSLNWTISKCPNGYNVESYCRIRGSDYPVIIQIRCEDFKDRFSRFSDGRIDVNIGRRFNVYATSPSQDQFTVVLPGVRLNETGRYNAEIIAVYDANQELTVYKPSDLQVRMNVEGDDLNKTRRTMDKNENITVEIELSHTGPPHAEIHVNRLPSGNITVTNCTRTSCDVILWTNDDDDEEIQIIVVYPQVIGSTPKILRTLIITDMPKNITISRDPSSGDLVQNVTVLELTCSADARSTHRPLMMYNWSRNDVLINPDDPPERHQVNGTSDNRLIISPVHRHDVTYECRAHEDGSSLYACQSVTLDVLKDAPENDVQVSCPVWPVIGAAVVGPLTLVIHVIIAFKMHKRGKRKWKGVNRDDDSRETVVPNVRYISVSE